MPAGDEPSAAGPNEPAIEVPPVRGDASSPVARGNARRRVLAVVVGFEVAVGVVGWVLAWALGQAPLQQLVPSGRDLVVGLVATIPLLGLFWLTVRYPVGPLGHIADILDEILVPFLKPCTVLDLALIALVAGVGEELLFRGALQAELVEHWGLATGITVASLLFGLAHCVTITYAVLATAIGAYLGILYQANGTLAIAVIVHGLYDFGALLYLLRWSEKGKQP